MIQGNVEIDMDLLLHVTVSQYVTPCTMQEVHIRQLPLHPSVILV